MTTSVKVVLSGQSAAARDHRGSHMQIIACAGAGKTETVSQRVVALVAEGVEPRSIVAFTFTERAAAEQTVLGAIDKFRKQEFAAQPGNHCKMCDVRKICKSAK